MDFDFKEDQPIFLQLAKSLEQAVAFGELKAGQKLPSVRELASASKTNPNTVQKALRLLEDQGLIHTQRTNGKFVCEDESRIEALRKKRAIEIVERCQHDLEAIGLDLKSGLALYQDLKEPIE